MGKTENQHTDRIIQTLFRFDVLNKLPRTGFAIRGIPRPETLGEHCFSASVLAAILIDEIRSSGTEINGEKVLKMAILHETGEILVGDIPHPASVFMGTEVKQRMERAAGKQVLLNFPGLQEIIDEFEAGTTIESRLIRGVDKLQMMIKVLIYESEGQGYLEDFWTYPKNFIETGIPVVDTLFSRIKKVRGKIHLDYLGMTSEQSV